MCGKVLLFSESWLDQSLPVRKTQLERREYFSNDLFCIRSTFPVLLAVIACWAGLCKVTAVPWLEQFPSGYFYRHIELDAAVLWMESRGHSGITWMLPHHASERMCVVLGVANGIGQLGPPVEYISPCFTSCTLLSVCVAMIHWTEGFIPVPNIFCSCILPWDICAAWRFAPETIVANGRLSSNVYELLLTHRVKSRACDLGLVQSSCLFWQWLCHHRRTCLVNLTPLVNSLKNSERGGHSFVQDF